MNTGILTGAHLGILLVSMLGFFALAVATDRHGEHLLGRMPAAHWRLTARILGWVLLAASLAWGIVALGTGVGITLWLGWLTLAALIWVFTFPKWPWQPPVRERAARKPKAEAEPPVIPVPRARRRVAAVLLLATVLGFGVAVSGVGPHPLERPDVIKASVGPWAFTMVEADQGPPEVMEMDIPMKEFRLRFCDACNRQIRQASLKVNRPRSAQATGMAFSDLRWERRVEIPLPSTVTADSELWLTVVGKDGSVHQKVWRMSEVAPATVAWFDAQRKSHAQP